MTTFSTHVLDATLGRPAEAMVITLALPDGTERTGETDADGRARIDGDLPTGVATLTFRTGEWFARQGRETFYPEVTITFTVTAGEHHHVPLLLSPFSYSTYRGS